jgi:hypothetical protein
MSRNPKIVEQMRDRQKRVFRIAMDPQRFGLTLKMIEADSGLGYDSLRNYASGDTIMPLTALDALVGVIPDELLSLLLSEDRAIVRVPDGIDHDAIAEWMVEYLAAKQEAHRPESPAGREIAPCEDNVLRVKFAKVKAA